MTSKTWTILDDEVEHYDTAAVAINDSQVLITCGHCGDGHYINAFNDCAIYEPYSTTEKMKKIVWSDGARFLHSVVTLNGYVYMIGGVAEDDDFVGGVVLESVERIAIDKLLTEQSWEDVPSMRETRYSHMSVAVDGAIYAFGGKNVYAYDGDELSSGESFNPVTKKWTELPEMPMAKSDAGIAVVGRKIYIIGGRASNFSVRRVDIFNLDTALWEVAPDLPIALHLMSATTVGDYIVVAGGITEWSSKKRTDKTYIFNTKTNEWLEGKRDLSLKRSNHSLVYLQKIKELIAIGGTYYMQGNGNSIEKVHFGTLLSGVHKWDYLRLRLLVKKNRATSLIMKEKNKADMNLTSPPKKKGRDDTRDEKDLRIVTQFITDSNDDIFKHTLSFLY